MSTVSPGFYPGDVVHIAAAHGPRRVYSLMSLGSDMHAPVLKNVNDKLGLVVQVRVDASRRVDLILLVDGIMGWIQDWCIDQVVIRRQ